MKVILLQELKGKGGEGDVVDVAPGFANNYLVPNKMAIIATKGNLKQLEQRKHNIAKREESRVANALKLKETFEGQTVKVVAKVGEEGQLFGSITTQMIADALKEAVGIDIDKRRIELGRAIKTAGEHKVQISLYRDIKTSVNLLVGDIDIMKEPEVKAEKKAEEAAPEKAAPEKAAEAATPEKAAEAAAAPAEAAAPGKEAAE